ncbi:hypothetical protein LB505_006785 [Fusarium chuoi]|nr:hypothetical protein LB505_006785 [Fusarium chuoi]
MVKKHQSLVRIPSICYDDMGDLDTDDRWKPFYDIPKMLKKAYPTVKGQQIWPRLHPPRLRPIPPANPPSRPSRRRPRGRWNTPRMGPPSL